MELNISYAENISCLTYKFSRPPGEQMALISRQQRKGKFWKALKPNDANAERIHFQWESVGEHCV